LSVKFRHPYCQAVQALTAAQQLAAARFLDHRLAHVPVRGSSSTLLLQSFCGAPAHHSQGLSHASAPANRCQPPQCRAQTATSVRGAAEAPRPPPASLPCADGPALPPPPFLSPFQAAPQGRGRYVPVRWSSQPLPVQHPENPLLLSLPSLSSLHNPATLHPPTIKPVLLHLQTGLIFPIDAAAACIRHVRT
jgi:hypothetical protein